MSDPRLPLGHSFRSGVCLETEDECGFLMVGKLCSRPREAHEPANKKA